MGRAAQIDLRPAGPDWMVLMAIKIDLVDITKKFGDYTAVDSISLTVNPAEFVCLLGPSGCGKTTTLRMIAGLEIPTGGNIYFDGKEVGRTKVYERNTAMVFQDYALFPHKTVRENIIFGLRMRKVEKSEIESLLKWSMDIVSITGLEDRYPNQLSGGQRQRVALARAIVYEPDVLLLDEPLSALDKKLRDQMRFELRRIQQKVGITTIFVTHDQEEAMSMADKIVIMEKAKIVQEGAPDEIYRHPLNLHVANFLGTSNLFTGQVERTAQGCCLRLPGQNYIPLAFEEPEGTTITVGARPQSFSFQKEEGHDCWVEALFEAESYLGTNIRYLMNFCGNRIYVEALNSDTSVAYKRFASGQRVTLYFSSKNLNRLEA